MRILFLFFLIIISLKPTFACDGCGALSSSSSNGVLSSLQRNFLSLSYEGIDYKLSSINYEGKDYQKLFQLSAKFHLLHNSKWWVGAKLPLRINRRDFANENTVLRGFSDSQVLISYVLLNQLKEKKLNQVFLEATAGLSFPTGKYDSKIQDRNLPENFNLGRGALGFVSNVNTLLKFERFSIENNAWFIDYAKSNSGYHFGSQFVNNFKLLKNWYFKMNQLIYFANIQLNHVAQDSYENGNKNLASGSTAILGGLSANIRVEKFWIGALVQFPLYEKFASPEISVQNYINAQLAYIF